MTVTTNRRAEFTAKHLRLPTADEERELAEQERADRREAEAQRSERELKRAYLSANPGADEATWEKEKAAVLADDRKSRAKAAQEQQRRSAQALYKAF